MIFYYYFEYVLMKKIVVNLNTYYYKYDSNLEKNKYQNNND